MSTRLEHLVCSILLAVVCAYLPILDEINSPDPIYWRSSTTLVRLCNLDIPRDANNGDPDQTPHSESALFANYSVGDLQKQMR